MFAVMAKPLLADAFAHHAWATEVVIDTCLSLNAGQLDTTAAGTYGSILDTLRHLVQADSGYLFALTSGRVPVLDARALGLPELRAAITANAAEWSTLLATDLDPDAVVVRRRDDGSETHAPVSIRLAQALHHGTDHRSQVCTDLTAIGVEPPDIDLWAFGVHDGRVVDTGPTA